MKKQLNNIVTAVSVMALLGAVSCNKEKSVETAGSTIRFGVSTVYENGPATKTEYSGKDQNNNSISSTSTAERIDWLPTDQIRILCYHDTPVGSSDEQVEYADYQIELSGSGTDQTHSADLSPIGNGLQWGEGVHDFIALYPSPAQLSEEHAQLTYLDEDAVVSTIPATQTATLSGHVFKPDMNYAYMYAVTSGVEKGSNVQLDFKPLVTTLEFTLLTRAGDAITSNLTSVKLSSTQRDAYLTGNFCAYIDKVEGFQSLDPDNNVIDGGNEITITLPDGGVQLSTTDAYTVTFLTLPMNQTELTLTLGFENGTKRTLELKNNGSWITVPACKKTYIWKVDAPLTVDTYTIDPLKTITLTYAGGSSQLSNTTAFKSYKTSGGATTPVSFKFQYADSESGPWTDGLPAWLTGDAGIDYNGSTSGQTLNITMAAQSNSGEDTHATTLKGAIAKNNFDLSTVDVSTGNTVNKTTANCYVVQAPGSYKFPLVYGNALKNGSVNDAAFHRQQSTATRTEYLEYYLDHNDEQIKNDSSSGTNCDKNSVYIAERFSSKTITAELLWTDAPGLVTNVSFSGSGTDAYITFEVPSETICQGNALIAVKVNDEIAWSWHIWVTDENLSALYEGSDGYKFPAVNLGWCDGKSSSYAERTCYVKAVQTVSSGVETAPVKITQSAGTVTTGGNNPYYQWGRKDPFMASNGTGNTNKTYYGTNKPTDVARPNTLTLGGAIKKPYERYYRTTSPFDWCSTTYYNTWNSTIAGYGSGQYSTTVTKTIYDPSPVGFKMPPQSAYSSFSASFQGSQGSQGYSLKVGSLLFPASGYRGNDSASLYDVWYYGHYWSAVPYNSHDGYRLYFSTSVDVASYNRRSYGFAVRPVQE